MGVVTVWAKTVLSEVMPKQTHAHAHSSCSNIAFFLS